MQTQKIEFVNELLKSGILLSPEYLSNIDSIDENFKKDFFNNINNLEKTGAVVLNDDFFVLKKLSLDLSDVNWSDIDKSRVNYEKGKDSNSYGSIIEELKKTLVIPKKQSKVKILNPYFDILKKREVADFVKHFNVRFNALERILRNRSELSSVSSINRILAKKDKGNVAIIGMVLSKSVTKNGNLILELEDPTGVIKAVINKDKSELFLKSNDILLDEVIGITGNNGSGIIFANNVFWPDIPLNREIKKSPDEVYAIFVSDFHFGSKHFLFEEYDKFLKWINGEMGDEKQKDLASKIMYLFIAGDLVDGVGIYPGHDKDVTHPDIYEQYDLFTDFISKIPKHINVIISPGNHDAMRIAEPQLELYKDFTLKLWEMENVTMTTNPSIVNIHASDNFEGFDVLIYHGYSFPFIADNVQSIRSQGGLKRADLIMKFVLQRRHLAPTHESTLYIPQIEKDPLVIEKVPDFLITGHIHRVTALNYKSITLLNCSSWMGSSDFQEKVGLKPQPARVPIVNLQTREVKILKFIKGDDE